MKKNTSHVSHRHFLSCQILILLPLLLAGSVFGANDTWNGGATPNFKWNVSGNWDTLPVANDYLFFDGSTGLANTNDFTAGTAFNGLTFNSGAGAFTLSGNAINLNGGITNSSPNLQTVRLDLALQANEAVNAASGDILLGGVLTGGSFGLTKLGSGTVAVTNNNSLASLAINAGTLQVGGGSFSSSTVSNFSIGGVTSSGSRLIVTNTSVTMGSNNFTLGGIATSTNATVLVLSNAVVNNSGQVLQLTAGVSNLFVINSGTVTNVGTYSVGNGGGGSTLIVTNGGKLFTGVAGSFWSVGRGTPLDTMIVTGTNTLWDNGGKVFRLGETAVANSNTLVVASGALATNINAMYIPDNAASTGEQLIVTNGGKLYCTSLNLGQGGGSSTNSVLIANGSFVSVAGGITSGANSGSGNQLTIANASATLSGVLQVGGNAASSNNIIQIQQGGLVTLTGSGSGARVNLGNGTGNAILMSGVISNAVGIIIGNGAQATNDAVIVTNGGQFLMTSASSDIYDIGRNAGATGSTLSIVGSGSLFNAATRTLAIGGTAGATLNSLMSISSGGVFTNGSISVGGNGTGHQLVISNGTVYANNFTVNGNASVSLIGGSGDTLYADNFVGGNSGSIITGAVAGASQLIAGFKNSSSTVTPLLAGNIALTKTGTGTLTIGNANNNFYGNIVVNGGALAASASSANPPVTGPLGNVQTSGRTIAVTGALLNFTANNIFGNAGATAANLPVINLTNATLSGTRYNQLNDVLLNGSTITQTNGTDTGVYQCFQFLGSVTVAGTSASTISSSNGKGHHLGANTAFNIASTASGGADLTVSAPLIDQSADYGSAAGGLTKSGNGILVLSGTNTYTGATTVNAGKLVLYSYSLQSGTVSVNDGATLDVTSDGISQITNSTLTIGSSAGAAIEFVNLTSTTIAPVVTPALNLNGTATLNLLNPTFVAGNQYPLVVFTTKGGTGDFVIGAKPRGSVMNLVTNDNGNGTFTLVLNVSALGSATTDVWSGSQNGNWDINTSTNWTISASPNTYFEGDFVQFTDSSSVTNVTLAATVTPGSTTVNSSKNYTLLSNSGSHIAGAGGLSKSGTGTLTLTNLANTYTGTNSITGGKVVISADNNLGASSNLLVLSGGTLSAAGSLTLSANHTLMLGAGTIDVASGQTMNFAGIITNNTPSVGSLTKTGAGTLNLTGTNTYNGSTTVSAGKLILTTAQQSGGAITVSDGAALRTAVAVSGAQLPVSTLTLGSSGATTVEFQGISGTNAAIVATNLTVNGTVTINLLGGAVALGEIPLINYVTKSGSGTFTMGTIPPNITGVITNDTTHKLIALNITSIGQLTWSGAVDSTWDIATTSNWLFGVTGSVYSDNSPVFFGNTGAGTLTLAGPVAPGNVTVSNTIANYTWTAGTAATGINGPASITKLGTGTVTLNPMTNGYSGGTVIGGGQFIIAVHSVSAPSVTELGTGTVLVTNGLLVLNGVGGGSAINPRYITNDITLNGGGLFGTDGGQHFQGTVNVVNSGSVGQVWFNKLDYLDGPLTGSGTLTIPGSGINGSPSGYGPVFITSSANSFNGTVTVNNGALGIQDTAGTALQNAIVNLVGFNGNIPGITNGSYVSPILWTSNTSFTVTLGGLAGTALLNIDANFGVALILGNNRSDAVTYSGVLGGGAIAADTVTKVGSGTQWLIGTNTYSSATYINQGTLGISTYHAGGGDFTVADSAGLSITNRGAGSAAIGNATLGASTLTFQQVASTTTPLVSATGALTVNGASTVVITGTNGLAAGNEYPLWSASSIGGSGSFGLSVPAGITANLVTNGTTLALDVTAIASPVNTTPTNILFTVSGNQMVLSWPADHTGWHLQTQTNSLSAGLGTNWVTIPNTDLSNSYTNTINPANPTVFYRLVYP